MYQRYKEQQKRCGMSTSQSRQTSDSSQSHHRGNGSQKNLEVTNSAKTSSQADAESQVPEELTLKRGLEKDEIVEAALHSRVDVLYPSLAKVVRIFTSSTFTDTHVERNALMKNVYPRLVTYCRERGYDFQVVDMRWGVREAATEDHLTTQLCMQELQECQKLSTGPNFVTFLAQKYGYRPFPSKVAAAEFEKLLSHTPNETERKLLKYWFLKDMNQLPPAYILQPITANLPDFINSRDQEKKKKAAEKWWSDFEKMQLILRHAADVVLLGSERQKYFWSVTENEICNGILEVDNPKKHCLWFRRNIDDLEGQRLGRFPRRFMDLIGDKIDDEAHRLITDLKEKKIPSKLAQSNIFSYRLKWWENGVDPTVSKEHANYVDKFQDDFHDGMARLIRQGIEERQATEITNDLHLEVIAHAQFAQAKCSSFHGRQDLLGKIWRKISQSGDRFPLVLCGQPGTGKTALVARCVQEILDKTSAESDETLVVTRFIGTTPDSSGIRRLLITLCRQISTMVPVDDAEELIGMSMRDVVEQFRQCLDAVSEDGMTLYLLLDSLDQLDSSHNGPDMDWLPLPLPDNVYLLLSAIPDERFRVVPKLKNRIKERDSFLNVPELSAKDVTHILSGYLRTANRMLQPKQMTLLQDSCRHCAIPLYLKLCVDQAIKWNSYTRPDVKVIQGSVKEVIRHMFQKMEKYHGYLLISHGLGLITAAKHGLGQNEIEDILSLDDEVLNDVYQHSTPPLRRLPPLLWVRIRAELKDYLTDRGAEGATVVQWYHREFFEVAEQCYLSNLEVKQKLHALEAEYFLGKWANGVRKPFVDRQGSPGAEDRLVAAQPYIFKEATEVSPSMYNHRKLSELPYHLILAGDVDLLKEEVFCNFHWLNHKTKASGFDSVLDDFAFAKDQGMLDAELNLVYTAFRVSKEGIKFDPNQLPIQLGGRLLSVKLDGTMKHVKKLIEDCQNPGYTCFVATQGFLPPTGLALITKLIGHNETISAVGVSDDKTTVVSFSNDHMLIVWDLNLGLEVRRLPYRNTGVSPDIILISKDNNQLFITCRTHIDILSIYSPDVEQSLELDHEALHLPVNICFSPTRDKLLAMTDKTLHIWEVNSLEKIHTFSVPSPPLELYNHASDFMTAHKDVVIFFRRSTDHFYIFKPETFAKTQEYVVKRKFMEENAEKMYSYLGVTCQDQLVVVSFHEDMNKQSGILLQVYHALTGDFIRKFDLKLRAVVMLYAHVWPSSNGNHIFFPNVGREAMPFHIMKINLDTGKDEGLVPTMIPYFNVVVIDDKRALTLSATNTQTIEVKDLESGMASAVELDPDCLVSNDMVQEADHIWTIPDSSETKRYIAGSTRLNEMFVYDLAEQKFVRKLKPNGLCIYGKVLSKYVIFMNFTQQIVVYDLMTLEELIKVEDHCDYQGCFDAVDSDHIIYATSSGPLSEPPSVYKPAAVNADLLKILRLSDGKVTKKITLGTDLPIKYVKVSKNGEVLVCTVTVAKSPAEECKLIAYDLEADKKLPDVEMPKLDNMGYLGGYCLTPDGNHVIFGHSEQTNRGYYVIKVWNTRKGEARCIDPIVDSAHQVIVMPLAYMFSETINSIVVLHNGGDLGVWDLETLNLTYQLKTASINFLQTKLSLDGRFFICNGKTMNTVIVVDLTTGKRIGSLASDGDIRSFNVTPDGNTLLIGGVQVRFMAQIFLHRQESGEAVTRRREVLEELRKQPKIFGEELIVKDYFVAPQNLPVHE